jgi:methionyl-tRNA formyltransferase
LTAWRPDAIAVVAYGALLPESALAISEHGWINLHLSLLPAWRGAAPVQRAMWAGDQVIGATTVLIVKELDAGPVYGVMTYEPPGRATAGFVLDVLARDGAKLLVATIDLIAAGQAEPRPQSADGVSYAHRITTAEAEIDWAAPAVTVDRQIRACTPAPGAWTVFRGRRLKIGPVLPVSAPGDLLGAEVGTVTAAGPAIEVRTGSGLVELGQVAPAGKSWMEAAAWARGARVGQAERLGI